MRNRILLNKNKHYLYTKIIFAFIPPWKRMNILFRVCLSILLISIISMFIVAKLDKNLPLLYAVLSYNPVEHANNLYKKGQLITARDFINFYISIPNAQYSNELIKILNDIEETRGTWNYRINETWKGIIGEESEETYGKAVELVTEFTPIGDVRVLYSEGKHALNDEDIDTLNTSLAAISLGLSVVSVGPQAPLLAPLKSATNLFKKSLNLMSPSLRKSIELALQPIMKHSPEIKRSLQNMKLSNELATLITKTSSKFSDILNLGRKNPESAMLAIRYSDDVKQLAENAKLVMQMGEDAVGILTHGGKNSLEAAKYLQKSGILSGLNMKKAMAFGDAGLSWIRHLPLDDLLKQVRMIRLTVSGKIFYYIKWIMSKIPTPVAIFILIYFILIFYKLWFIYPIRKDKSI